MEVRHVRQFHLQLERGGGVLAQQVEQVLLTLHLAVLVAQPDLHQSVQRA